MNESIAYQWAAQCVTPLHGRCEPHIIQQVADKIASALIAATHTPISIIADHFGDGAPERPCAWCDEMDVLKCVGCWSRLQAFEATARIDPRGAERG